MKLQSNISVNGGASGSIKLMKVKQTRQVYEKIIQFAMDDEKLIQSKLMELYSKFKIIRAEKNPHEIGSKQWVKWVGDQTRKYRENDLASQELLKMLPKDDSSSWDMDKIDWNVVLAPALEESEKYKQRIIELKKQNSDNPTALNNDAKEAERPVDVETVTQNDDSAN